MTNRCVFNLILLILIDIKLTHVLNLNFVLEEEKDILRAQAL
jgi:hypothetical protein